jgi:phage gp36-like protein
MPAPYATAEQFVARLDERFAAQLTSADGTTVDAVKVSTACADATAELYGYVRRIPEDSRPDEDTLRVHCIKVALYLLSMGRPGKEYDSIRNAYNDTIAYYKELLTAATAQVTSPLGVSSDAPAAVFTDASLRGFVPGD